MAIGAPLNALGSAGSAVGGPAVDALQKLAKALTDVGKAVEVALLPALKVVAELGKAVLAPVFRDLGERLRFVGDVVKFTVAGAFEKVGEVARRVGANWTELKSQLAAVGLTAVGAGGLLAGAFGPAFAALAGAAAIAVTKFTAALREAGYLDKLADAAKRVSGAVGSYLKDAGGAAVNAVASVGKALGSVATLAGAAAGAAAGLGLALKGLVEKANPVVAEQFTLALNDLLAVVGQALTPVFKLVTEVVRMAGDTLAGFAKDVGSTLGTVLRPVIDVLGVVFDIVGRIGQSLAKAFEAAAPALEAIGQAVLATVQAVQPLVNLLIDSLGGALGAALGALGDVLTAVVPYVAAFARVVGDLLATVVRWVREALAFVGIDLPEGGPGRREGDSVGAAVRSASTTDVESVLKKARENAFSLGTASADPARRTASAAEELKKKADQIYERLGEILTDLPDKLARAILGDTITDAVEGAFDAIGDAKNAALDAGRGALTAVGLRDEDKPGGAFDDIVKRADEFRRRVRGEGPGVVGGGDF